MGISAQCGAERGNTMERKNAWAAYAEDDSRVEAFAKAYCDFINNGKTERECVALQIDHKPSLQQRCNHHQSRNILATHGSIQADRPLSLQYRITNPQGREALLTQLFDLRPQFP